jgi:hypothetical protein
MSCTLRHFADPSWRQVSTPTLPVGFIAIDVPRPSRSQIIELRCGASSAARRVMPEAADRKTKALSYENEEIVASFRNSYGVTLEEARELFEECKKWLWLCGTRPRSMRLTVFGPMRLLDEMWHTFILFTREYTEYCMTHFGFYIHHAPTTRTENEQYRQRVAANPEETHAKLREERREMMLLVHDELGEETLRRWFADYARYSDERLRGLLIKHLPKHEAAHA